MNISRGRASLKVASEGSTQLVPKQNASWSSEFLEPVSPNIQTGASPVA